MVPDTPRPEELLLIGATIALVVAITYEIVVHLPWTWRIGL